MESQGKYSDKNIMLYFDGIWNFEYGMWNMESQGKYSDKKTSCCILTEYGIRNMEYGIWNTEYRIYTNTEF